MRSQPVFFRHRVVAVFAFGAEWQFKGWPWNTPAEIFDNGTLSLSNVCCVCCPNENGLQNHSVQPTCCIKRHPSQDTSLFTVKAFHLHYDDEALNSKIATWNVYKLSVSKIKRYRDRSVVKSTLEPFWSFVCAASPPATSVSHHSVNHIFFLADLCLARTANLKFSLSPCHSI